MWQTFTISSNIRHFRRLLASDLDPHRRALIESLLETEERKLAALASTEESDRPASAPPPPH